MNTIEIKDLNEAAVREMTTEEMKFVRGGDSKKFNNAGDVLYYVFVEPIVSPLAMVDTFLKQQQK